MTRVYSLAHLTALPYAPPQLVRLAARSGCSACGVRLLPAAPGGVHHVMLPGSPLLAETMAAMRETGVRILDLEVIRIGESFDPRAFEVFFEVGAALGARHVLVAGDDPELGRLGEQFAGLCDVAAAYNLSCDLEPMPWCAVASVEDAARLVASAARPNGAVLVDALHFFRSASRLEDVRQLPRSRLNYAQICDGRVPGPQTTEGLIHDARCERLLPGEGGFDLPALFAALPADLPISIEIPSEARAPAMGYEAWAQAAVTAARRVLEATPPWPDARHRAPR